MKYNTQHTDKAYSMASTPSMAPKVAKPKFKRTGQKKATPSKTDSMYIFYTSLYKQNKKSTMATKWMLDHGVFSEKKAHGIMLALSMDKLSIKH